jgi:hypothetical protein
MNEWHQRGERRVFCCWSLRTYDYAPQPVDITLALLFSSATSNGLPHQLTKNFSNMMDIYQTKLYVDFHMRRASAGVWQGQNSNSVKKPTAVHSNPRASIRSNAWSTLGELIEFVEGDTGILAGKLQSKAREGTIAHWDIRF